MRRLILMVSLIVGTASMLSAQGRIAELWPNGIPGAVKAQGYTEVVDTTSGWTRISNVSTPTVEVYLPAKGKSNGTAVVICPGGGYAVLAVKHEGTDVAKWFNSLGVVAVVLKNRLPSDLIMKDKSIGPMQDVQEAIRYVRRNATLFGVNPSRIGVMGFSAGGHLAATASTRFSENVYAHDEVSARPDFSILIYPVISMEGTITHAGSRENLLGKSPSDDMVKRFSNELQVTGSTPPTFIIHSLDDNVVPVENSIRYTQALVSKGIKCETHLYQSGGHGYGMGRSKNSESSWTNDCQFWLKMNGLL